MAVRNKMFKTANERGNFNVRMSLFLKEDLDKSLCKDCLLPVHKNGIPGICENSHLRNYILLARMMQDSSMTKFFFEGDIVPPNLHEKVTLQSSGKTELASIIYIRIWLTLFQSNQRFILKDYLKGFNFPLVKPEE
jgi:hypothetical protein